MTEQFCFWDITSDWALALWVVNYTIGAGTLIPPPLGTSQMEVQASMEQASPMS